MIEYTMAELIYTHGTASFLMYHIGEIPNYSGAPEEKQLIRTQPFRPEPAVNNKDMIQRNLYTLCLNMLPEMGDDGGPSAA
ncbi:MAG: hypothetical protein GY906_24730 [bacterium]|nr:hypothetical protein [bacterium]